VARARGLVGEWRNRFSWTSPDIAAIGCSCWHRRAAQKRTSSTISINIPKKLHRFVIGPKGTNIQEILKTTGERSNLYSKTL